MLTVHPAILLAAFLALYFSDYILTMRAARLYQAGAKETIVLEGSYELNPLFVSDVDRLRGFSPRFLAILGLYVLLLGLMWFLTARVVYLPQVLELAVGAVLLVEGPIHIRHFRNFFTFRHAADHDGITGRIQYARWLSYRASAVELVAFAGLYLALAGVLGSSLLLGGAAACASLAVRHYFASRKAKTPMPVEHAP